MMAYELPDQGDWVGIRMPKNDFALLSEELEPMFWAPPISDQPSAWFGHTPFAAWLIATAKPRLLVELGTYTGVSYAAFCDAVTRLGLSTRCFAIDTWQGDDQTGNYGEGIFETFSRFHDSRYSAFSTLLRSTFDHAVSKFEDASIDLLHIDGFHSYEAVKHDFETWRPKLSDQAIVLLHDSNERAPGFGVWRFWKELSGSFPSFEFMHSHGLGVLCYGKNAAPALQALCDLDDTGISLVQRRFQAVGDRWSTEFRNSLNSHEIARRDNRIIDLERQLTEQSGSFDRSLQALLDRVDGLRRSVIERENAIAEIRRSTSWRLTGPIRKIVGWMRRSPTPPDTHTLEQQP
jgi:hypothetical protein